MTDTLFHSTFGDFALQRRPAAAPGQPLQAWDAADEYLLEELARHNPEPARCLLINDQFGALGVALQRWQPHSWSDSYSAHLALADNLARNHCGGGVTALPSTQPPPQRYAAVLWRIPKTLALLRQQTALLHGALKPDAVILAGAMIKHLPEQALEILRGLGTVDILHAQKKARLFRIHVHPQLPAPTPPADSAVTVPEYALQLSAGANVFARDKLDIGARFFLDQFAQLPSAQRIADLGCGNGVLGIVAQRLQPAADIVFFDESYQAVAAAEANYRRNIGAGGTAGFIVDDGLSGYRGEPFDLVLCNPPFHQSHVVGDQIAWQMFTQSFRHLRVGGELWVVGNRHLQYHLKLKKVFGNWRQVGGSNKFVVLVGVKR